MNIKEFWQNITMLPSNHGHGTVLYFGANIINSGSVTRMKIEGDALLQRMIERGEVVI